MSRQDFTRSLDKVAVVGVMASIILAMRLQYSLVFEASEFKEVPTDSQKFGFNPEVLRLAHPLADAVIVTFLAFAFNWIFQVFLPSIFSSPSDCDH